MTQFKQLIPQCLGRFRRHPDLITQVTGEAGAGLVKASCTAKGDLTGLDIDKSIFSGDDKEVVEDLILAAIKDAQQKAAERAKDEMGKMTEGLGLPPGMNLPF